MFTHLHVASAFSAHYGVDWPETLAAAAKAGGADALAVTDRDGLYGIPKHIGACLAAGIDPILGVELAVLDEDGVVGGRVVVLAHGHNQGAGYAALCRLVSAAHARKTVGVTRAEIAVHLLTETGPVGTVLWRGHRVLRVIDLVVRVCLSGPERRKRVGSVADPTGQVLPGLRVRLSAPGRVFRAGFRR